MPRSASVLRAPKHRDLSAPEFLWDARFTWLLTGHPKRISVRVLKDEAEVRNIKLRRWGKSKVFWAEGHTAPVQRLEKIVEKYLLGAARIGTPEIKQVGKFMWSYRRYTKGDIWREQLR